MQFNIDDETHKIDCVVTPYGHPLINASQYATAFMGCTPHTASNKLAAVASRFPQLQNCKRLLEDHDKVSITYLLLFASNLFPLTYQLITGAT